MSISIDIPQDIEQELRQQLGDLNQPAKEAMAIELYRQDRLSHYQLSQILGLSRFETDGVLKQHNVTEDLLTPEELAAQVKNLEVLLNR